MRVAIAVAALLGGAVLAMPGPAMAQETSTLCRFTSGPRAGQTQDYAPQAAIPVGSSCWDGISSSGTVVSRGASSGGTPAPPSGGPGGMSSVCHFTQGPRAGQSQDYAPQAPLPVGTPCTDGVSSTGTVQ